MKQSPVAGGGTEAGQQDMGLSGQGSTSNGTGWVTYVLYAILIVATVALATLLVGELVPESNEELRHLFIFDLAWPVFLIGSLAVLLAGVGALVADRRRRSSDLRRYAAWALGYLVVALVVLFAVGGFEL